MLWGNRGLALTLMNVFMGLSSFYVYAQNARADFFPSKTCPDCILIDYDDANNVTGTPPTAVGTLPSSLVGNFTLVFADEFSSSSIDLMPAPTNFNATSNKWHIEHTGAQAIDITTNTDFSISNGTLKLQQRFDGTNFMTTELKSNAYIRYGYIEARIKIPSRNVSPTKLFPAFWLQRNNMDPNYCIYEEFDIFEFFQGEAKGTNGSVNNITTTKWYGTTEHYDYFNTYPCGLGYRQQIGKNIIPMDEATVGAYRLDMTKDFFIWGVRWTQDSLIYFLNNKRVGAMSDNYVLDPQKETIGMQMILNCGVHLPPMDNGMIGNPTQMEIDYVRVYKEANDFPLMINSPSQICVGANNAYNRLWAVEDYIPGATYTFSILNPNGSYLISPVAATTDTWKYSFVPYIPAGTPTGNYTVRLTVVYPNPSGSGTISRTINKPLTIIPYALPATPTMSTTATFNRCQTVSLTNAQSGYSYSWWSSGVHLIHLTNTSSRVCCEDIFGIESGTVYVKAQNVCGTSLNNGSKSISLNCYCPNCTVRMRQDSLLYPVSAVEDCKKGEKEPENGEITLSPNPCNDKMWVQYYGDAPLEVAIYTWEGYKLKEVTLTKDQNSIDTQDIPKGTYYLRVNNGRNYTTFPLTIIH